jgi:hypothetical protein
MQSYVSSLRNFLIGILLLTSVCFCFFNLFSVNAIRVRCDIFSSVLKRPDVHVILRIFLYTAACNGSPLHRAFYEYFFAFSLCIYTYTVIESPPYKKMLFLHFSRLLAQPKVFLNYWHSCLL